MRGHIRHAWLMLLLWRWSRLMIRNRAGRTVSTGLRFGDFIDQRLRSTLDKDWDMPHRWLLLWLLLLGHLLLLFLTILLLVCVNFALPLWSLARCPRGRQLLPLHQPNTHLRTQPPADGQMEREALLSLGCSRKRLFALAFPRTILHLFSAAIISRPRTLFSGLVLFSAEYRF